MLAPYSLPAGLLNTAELRVEGGESRRRLQFLLVLNQSKSDISSFHSKELVSIFLQHITFLHDSGLSLKSQVIPYAEPISKNNFTLFSFLTPQLSVVKDLFISILHCLHFI